MDRTTEALKFWQALKPMIDAEIKKQTSSCVRSKKMKVTSPPNGVTIGVAEPYGDTHNVPYSSALNNANVGDSVWVWWFFGNASTMIALAYGDGQITNPYAITNEAPKFHINTQTMELVYQYPAGSYASDSFAINQDGDFVVNDGGNYPETDYAINANQFLQLNY